MLVTWVVPANHSTRTEGRVEISFSIFLNMKVYSVFSLESPHRGDSNKNTKYTIFNIKKKIIPNLQLWDFSHGLKNKFETAVVNAPSVFEPLKFYCNFIAAHPHHPRPRHFCSESLGCFMCCLSASNIPFLMLKLTFT